MSAISEEWDRRIAELADHYNRLAKLWAGSDLPHSIWKTPDWESGYSLLLDWYECRSKQLDWPSGRTSKERFFGWPSRQPPLGQERDHRPSYEATWAHEVHVFSHILNPDSGHSLRHAAIEEEGARLVLQWWNERPQDQAPGPPEA
jgi:hypothetical protein